jgi:hypothetical protein
MYKIMIYYSTTNLSATYPEGGVYQIGIRAKNLPYIPEQNLP